MSYHRGAHYYALCDVVEGGQRCEEFVLPPVRWDPTASSGILTPRGDVFNAAKDAGWLVEGDQTVCPKHRPAPREISGAGGR